MVLVYIYPSFFIEQNCSSQPPSIGGHFGGPDLSNIRGEVLILIFWKKVDMKG
jgi:hypothetical protein